jgi:hypothetical protein
MPISYQIYPEAGILVVRSEGIVTQREREGAMLAWLADPDYRTCIDALCDFSEAENVPSHADLHELVMILGQHLPARGPKKVAMVAHKIITFGVARVFADMIRDAGIPLTFDVFDDREHAWTWLRPAHAAVDRER